VKIAPGARPDWIHRELTIEIGGQPYLFRTLSLYDVWCLWPHLAPIAESIKAGHPLQLAEHLAEILRVLNPVLANSADIISQVKPVHVNLLIEFYRREHDWKRIKQLGDRSAAGKPEPVDAEQAENNFFLICRGASHFSNMSVQEFVSCRFEFCADAIMALSRIMEEQDKGLTIGQFVQVMGGLLPTQKVTEDTRPAWVKELDSRAN